MKSSVPESWHNESGLKEQFFINDCIAGSHLMSRCCGFALCCFNIFSCRIVSGEGGFSSEVSRSTLGVFGGGGRTPSSLMYFTCFECICETGGVLELVRYFAIPGGALLTNDPIKSMKKKVKNEIRVIIRRIKKKCERLSEDGHLNFIWLKTWRRKSITKGFKYLLVLNLISSKQLPSN